MAMHKTLILAAGVPVSFSETGNFFRLMLATAPVTVRFYAGGKTLSDAENVPAGYAETFSDRPFTSFDIVSAVDQTVQFASRFGSEVHMDMPPTGAVYLDGQQGAYVQTNAAPGAVNTQIRPAKSNRRYLMIQNKHATDVVYLTFDGSVPAAGNGLKLAAGGFYEPLLAPTGEIRALGTAGNPPLFVVEV